MLAAGLFLTIAGVAMAPSIQEESLIKGIAGLRSEMLTREVFAQLIVPKDVPASPSAATQSPAPSPSSTPSQNSDLHGEWTGKWTNRDKTMSFVLRIWGSKGDRLSAEGKADTWTLTEVFEGSVSGDRVTLTGLAVLPPPPAGKHYSLDVLNLTLSQDRRALTGTWVDKENSRGEIEVTRQSQSTAPLPPSLAADLRSIAADANEAINTAFRTGSTKAFLERAAPGRLSLWEDAAGKGAPEALWLLGCCYDNGVGVGARDPSRALQFYLRAAEKDYGPALNDVGLCYARGTGVQVDMSKAVMYYQRAAEKGRPSAWYNLGSSYEQGLGGLPKDIVKAVDCYRKAKELGYDLAARALARLGR